MQKDELIQMHALLAQLRSRLMNEQACRGNVGKQAGSEYDRLGVSPLHVHRSKTDHKRAVFLLGKELAEILATGEFSNAALASHRFDSWARRSDRAPQAPPSMPGFVGPPKPLEVRSF